MSRNEQRLRYELTAIFGSKIPDQNFEQFGHEFLTDQQTARSYYELEELVKIFTNRLRFSYEFKNFVNSWRFVCRFVVVW